MKIRSPLSVSRPSHCRGNTLIEFALVLPILLLLIFGVVDYGRAIQFANILTGISGESANLAARTPASARRAQPHRLSKSPPRG